MTFGRAPLLRGLLGDAELEALFTDEADLEAMLRTESALALAEAAAGLIPPEAASAIVAACATFTPDWGALAAGLGRDGVVIPALVRQLRAAVGDPHAPAVHMGATSQDIIDTSLVLRLGPALDQLDRRLTRLATVLSDIADRSGPEPLMAYTRMQAALPFTVADKIETWTAPLRRHGARLAEIRPRLLVLQLGGPVGTRAELGPSAGAVADDMAARLGLGVGPAWHAQRDGPAEFAGWLSLVTGALGKIGQDVALLAQSEVAAVTLASAGTSSAMAHKQNPVGAEVLVALARFNAGLLGTLHQSLVHENERSGAAWTLEWLVFPQMVVTAGASLRTALALAEGLRFS